MALFAGTAIVVFIIFLISYCTNKMRIINGFLLWCFIFCAGATYLLFVSMVDIPFLQYTVAAIGFLAGLLLLFGAYILIGLLFLNAVTVMRRERWRLSNSLTLIIGVVLVALAVVSLFVGRNEAPIWLRMIWGGTVAVLFVYFMVLASFLTSVWLCNLSRPRKQPYIIILGSGLIRGEVPPLLAARINKGIRIYQRMKKKRRIPKLIMSGGQGPDEPCPEAEAMKVYALEKGVPEGDILVEPESRSTAENMAFSKRVMEADGCGPPFPCVYVTSNYHVFRAGLLAKNAGLKATGVGAGTALYYLPNALLREFIALLWGRKRRNFIVISILFFIGAFLAGKGWIG